MSGSMLHRKMVLYRSVSVVCEETTEAYHICPHYKHSAMKQYSHFSYFKNSKAEVLIIQWYDYLIHCNERRVPNSFWKFNCNICEQEF